KSSAVARRTITSTPPPSLFQRSPAEDEVIATETISDPGKTTRPAVEDSEPIRDKKTVYVDHDLVIKLNELQLDALRSTGKKATFSELLEEGIRLLLASRQE